MSDAIVKNLNFGIDARDNVFKGIQKLTQAVKRQAATKYNLCFYELFRDQQVACCRKYEKFKTTFET